MAKDRGDFDRKVHRALAHPLRARILEAARENDEISPVQLASDMGESLGVVSYHVRALADAGLLELAGTSFRRGAVKHHYRAAPALGVTVRMRVSADKAKSVTDRIRKIVEDASKEGGDDVELTVVVHHDVAGAGGGRKRSS